MNKEKTEERYTTLDAYQAGFLTLKGHVPKLIEQGSKIIFSFSIDEIFFGDLAAYNSGATVEALKLAIAVKTLKSQIHSMRKNKGNFRGCEKIR
jgi:hypothetical protein